MPTLEVLFSPRARVRLEELADYVFERSRSVETTLNFIDRLEGYICDMLSRYPEAGRPAKEYGAGVRKLVYERFSILYQIKQNRVEILTLFRENQP